MTTKATINGLPLDEGSFSWLLYRGTKPQRVKIHGFGARWEEYRDMVANLNGEPAEIVIEGTRRAGGKRGAVRVVIAEVFVTRAIRKGETACELWCYDSRLKLRETVNDLDFNMTFGDGKLDGTEFDTYAAAIEAYCRNIPAAATRLADDAFERIPDRDLENNAHLSAMLADDPLAYLSHRANVDLTMHTDGKWYFAARDDATLEWFGKYEREAWRTRPGFLALEHLVLQRPQTIRPYYWEHHCIKVQGADPNTTISSSAPEQLRVELRQRYLYDGEYLTLRGLCEAHGFASTFVSDADIAGAYHSATAQGTALHPLDTFQRKSLWRVIQRDWRTRWKLDFPDALGHIGGWDQYRFGKLNADGSIDPTSVECPWVEYRKVVLPQTVAANGNKLLNAPWTFNNDAPAPFKVQWDDGPESGVVRLYLDPEHEGEYDLIPPRPGTLYVNRTVHVGGNATSQVVTDDALRIVWKDELGVPTQRAGIRNADIHGRDDISKGRFQSSFNIAIYMVARRFMPNDNSRWHREDVAGFDDGDIDVQELPPSDEVFCYRTFVGGDNAAEDDGLGAILNQDELTADAERRAEVYKITSGAIGGSEGRADTLNMVANNPRIVDGPVQSVGVHLDGVETYTTMTVGDLGDDRARQMTADKRLAARKVQVQGRDS